MKVCTKCEEKKPLSEFHKYKQSRDGLKSRCKSCKKEDDAAYREDNLEQVREASKQYKAVNREKVSKASRKASRKYREANREKVREAKRQYYSVNCEKVREASRQYTVENPEKRRAHKRVSTALNNGTLTKPTTCAKCNRSDLRIESHHEDYSKPLEVDWLCKSCHQRLHAKKQEKG